MNTNQTSCQTLDNMELDTVPISSEQFNDILNVQIEILGMVASHDNFNDILAHLCLLAEKLLPNSVASIMLQDEDTGLMSVLSAPSIPQAGHDALANLKPGPGGGSCGNAVFHNEAQFVKDTHSDGRWCDIRDVATDFNICSCWSMPVRRSKNKPIGTFALSSFEHRSPAPFHKKLLETAASITNIVLKNKENERRIQLFSTAMQNATEGIMITDKNNHILEVNKTFERIYGLNESDIIGKNPSVISSGTHDKNFYKSMWKSIKEDNTWSGEVTNKKADGTHIEQWVSITSLNDKVNYVDSYLAIFTDLTQLHDAQDEIKKMAYIDLLTSLYSKAHLEEKLSNDIEQTLIILNVVNFSYINSAYGFETGDKLLIEIASILKEHCQSKEIFRINSDEFAVLFDEGVNVQERVSHIRKLFYGLELDIDSIKLNISFAFGAATSKDNVFINATQALKKAQEQGKSNLYVFNDSDDVSQSKLSFIASNNLLNSALKEDRVIPYFQGIRDNKTGKIEKFEALVRITQGDKIISPFEFIETAKLSGLLPDITKVMIDKTFKIMSKNEAAFSINITEEDLNKDYLLAFLKDKALEYGLKSSRVILEILEGISADGKKNHIIQIAELKQAGFSIAIDDFGSEYSNFERVLELDIDFLKIDARYIKDIHTNNKSYEITKAISYFAKNTNIPCIAEFVHNAEVQKIVEELGISYSQGYHFSEPTAQVNLT